MQQSNIHEGQGKVGMNVAREKEQMRQRKFGDGVTLLIAFISLASILCIGTVLKSYILSDLLEWLRTTSPTSCIVYALILATWTTLCLPTTPFEVAAGFIYGIKTGLATATVGRVAGCCMAFTIGRAVVGPDRVRSWIESKGHKGLLYSLQRVASRRPIAAVWLVQCAYLPAALKAYGLSTAGGVRLNMFAAACTCTGLPFTLLWATTGSSASSLTEAMNGGGGLTGASAIWKPVLMGFALVALLAVLVIIGMAAKSGLTKEGEEEEGSHPLADERGMKAGHNGADRGKGSARHE
ncbi:hypothetical protein CYMTET_9200 [Cymbomonas tetramitiformis]|uniref:VTT domain-containing protein n=1 Tax=Cymbomonas tetramitiformis TaxID=36881 RepID=A0AAE0GRJ6_9CHLO|nr:hypothetical protein CYMTET_9200 [Cymbomonas tetramitiformis]